MTQPEEQNFLPKWMWIPSWSGEDDACPRIVLFRKRLPAGWEAAQKVFQISADSRYKLYVNGQFVQEGPSKGNAYTWYADTADIAPYLQDGENVIAVEVLRYPQELEQRNHSLYRTDTPCLYIAGENGIADGWKCTIQKGVRIVGEPFTPAPIHALEEVRGLAKLQGWKLPDYDDHFWEDAAPCGMMHMLRRLAQSPFHMMPRTIPGMRHEEKKFRAVICTREGTLTDDKWNCLLRGMPENGGLLIPAHSREIVEIDAGELETGYPQLSFAGGSGAQCTLCYAESYFEETVGKDGKKQYKKRDRTDWKQGQITGSEDHLSLGGFGTTERLETWEPFWIRTFRFIRLTIQTEEEPLVITDFHYRETEYPLEVKTHVKTSDPSLEDIWNISLRTLRRCMLETYVDCPYYEQLQYICDTRSEILFTYAVSADDRLARKAFHDFQASQRPDGLLNACAPSARINVIPTFSIYYILMLYDHMMYFGDKDLVRHFLPSVGAVLEFFRSHLTEQGLVGTVGGPYFRHPYWSFIDWTPQWQETGGVPTACLKGSGSITMESLLYLAGLQKAAALAEFIGSDGLAEEYRAEAESLKEAVRKNCRSSEGSRLIQDGPGVEEYSVHCQAFAVLTGVVSPDEGRKMLTETLGNPDKYAQCSVAMQYYLFRALEKADMYEYTDRLWDLWRGMLRKHLTTCVENDTDERSDCHSWGALALYELPCTILGVRPAAPGFSKMEVRPHPGKLTWASGDVVTPAGTVHVEWKKDKDGLHVTHSAVQE